VTAVSTQLSPSNSGNYQGGRRGKRARQCDNDVDIHTDPKESIVAERWVAGSPTSPATLETQGTPVVPLGEVPGEGVSRSDEISSKAVSGGIAAGRADPRVDKPARWNGLAWNGLA